jgi:hypothetical protein
MTDNDGASEAEVWTGDPGDLDELYAALRGVPGMVVRAVAAPPGPGEHGTAFDLLMVTISSGALTAFLQIIRVLAESRGPKFVLSIRRGKNRMKISADNIDEVEPMLRQLFGRR